MASIFKRKGKGSWIIFWFDHEGRRREKSSRTTDKRAAERIAAKLEGDAALRRDGVVDPRADDFASAERRSLQEHLADFHAWLLAKGNTPKHANMARSHVCRIMELCGADRISDLKPSVVQKAMGTIRDRGRSLRTCNSILRSVKTFAAWLHDDKRCRENVLAHLQGYNDQTDRKHVRRELLPQELLCLIETASQAPHVLGMSGPDRAMLYRVAAGTGFRRSEIESLTPDSFDLDAQPPTIAVNASYTKRRRDDVQPIREDLAALLRPWLARKRSDEPVFGIPEKTAKMLRHDLKESGIPYRDASGRVFDFHALRHGYISSVVAGGASVKTAQELARHSNPTLTIGRYSHARLHDLIGALDALPELTPGEAKPEAARATGTDDNRPRSPEKDPQHIPQHLQHETVRRDAKSCDDNDTPVHKGSNDKPLKIATLSDEVRRNANTCESEGDGARTRNLRIDSPML